MDVQKLMALIRENEGPKLDFKERIDLRYQSGKKEFAKDVCAIANSLGGRGYLVIGVKDKTKDLVGIKAKYYREEAMQQIISSRLDPPVDIRVEHIKIDDKIIGVVSIFKSNKRPHQSRQTGAFYVRRGSTTDIARRDEIAMMLQQGGLISSELTPLSGIDMDILNKDRILDYLDKSGYGRASYSLKFLQHLGIISYDRDLELYEPTLGGALLFSDNPQIYLKHTGIKIISKIDGKMVYKINGDLITLVKKAMDIIRNELKNYSQLYDVFEEAIINAVVHRDYFDQSREVVIYISKNKIEISNPGCIIGRERLNNLIRQLNPNRRNNWLYQNLLILDNEKKMLDTGVGLRKMKKNIEGIGKIMFLNLRKIDLFKIVILGFEAE